MKTLFKKTLVAALPLVGLLWGVSPALAHGDDWRHERLHDQLGGVHERAHDELSGLHEEFHEQPYSRQEHRRLHRWLNREHCDLHENLGNLHRDYHNRDWRWDRRYDGRWDRDNGYAERQHRSHGWHSGTQWPSWW